jgi:uncharacterized membrane protein YdbT with pleckstrin-like domain
MSYIDENLLPNEKVLFRTYLHWVIFILPVVLTFVGLGFLWPHSLLNIIGVLLLVVAVFQWFFSFLRYLSSEFAVTNKRVVIKTGFIRRSSYETLLQRIAGIQVDQSAGGRLFNYGKIVIFGVGGEKDYFVNIEAPLAFRKIVLEQIERLLENNPDQIKVKETSTQEGY